MARKPKYYTTNVMMYGTLLKKLIKVGYKGSHQQFRIVCKATSMAEANRICKAYGIGDKVFISDYTNDTGNDTEITESDKYGVIIKIGGTIGDNFIGIEDLLKIELD